MKATTFSFIWPVFFSFLFGLTTFSLQGQKENPGENTAPVIVNVPPASKEGKVFRFSNDAGAEIFLETAFDMFQRGKATYLSRFELKDGRYISFRMKNISASQNAVLRISYTQTGMEREHFVDLKEFVISEEEEWSSIEFQPELDARAKTFLRWELLSRNAHKENNDEEMISPVQKHFLDHEVLSYSQFSKLSYGGNQTMDITIGGTSHRLILEGVNLLSENYRITLFDGKKKTTVTPGNQAKTYAGAEANTGGKVRLTVADNFVSGFIEAGEEVYHIEPARFIEKSAAEHRLIMYNTRDAAPEKEAKCGVTGNAEESIRKFRQHYKSKEESGDRTTSDCRIVDYAIACDYSMFTKYNSSVTDLVNRNLAVMNNVQVNYIDQFERNYIFEITEQFLVTAPGGDPWSDSTNPEVLLPSFRSWGGSGFSGVFDIATLWTNRDFDGSTVGLAYVGVVCGFSRYNINQDFTTNQESIRVLLAHEMGHNFNAEHDASGAPFIMAPSVNPAVVNFSTQSYNQVKSYMDAAGSCATGCPPDTDPVCGGRFYDSGGADEKYGNNEVITTTICPDEEGDVVKVLFNFFKTEPGIDILSCYNGDNINAPQIWAHSGLSLPPANPVVGENPTGCLTFQFISNGSVVNDGWAASITCEEGGTCPAPVNLDFQSIDEESAELSWTDIGTAELWDIAYGEAGFIFNGLPDIVGTPDNPYLLSGLDQGVEYEFYVRSNCDGEYSNWSGPLLFSTQVINNTCGNAVLVLINDFTDCPEMSVTGSTVGATQTGAAPACNGGVGEFVDVWYVLNTGPASSFILSVENPSDINLGMQLFAGNCSNLSYTTCNVTSVSINAFPNLDIYIRFFTNTDLSEPGEFEFCLSTLPVVDNDTCEEAIAIDPGETCITTSGYTNGAALSMPAITCNGFLPTSPGGDVWYSFHADGFSDYAIILDMEVDAVLSLYRNNCGNLELVSCADDNVSAGVEEIEAGTLLEDTYYIRIYGWNQNGSFDLCIVSSQEYTISLVPLDQCIAFNDVGSGGDASVWTNIVDGNSNIIAALNLDGVAPGAEFTPVVYISSEIREDGSGVKYMNRDITIESSLASFPEPVPVRLFYSEQEINELIAEDESVHSVADIHITKSDIDCQGHFTGTGEFIPQTGSGQIGNTYFIEIEVSSFSTFFAHGGQAALPVTLLSFTGRTTAAGNILQWEVAEEINIERYDIERSVDGKFFTTFISEPASSAADRYSVLDKTPPASAYYRLKAVEWTGDYQYSPVIRIARSNSDKISVWPNPAHDVLKISSNKVGDRADYEIRDISGRIITTGRVSLEENIPVGMLKTGMYILSVHSGGNTEIVKFIKI